MIPKLKRRGWALLMALVYGVNPKPATGGRLVDEPQGATVSCYPLAVPYTTIESGEFSPDARFLAIGSSDVSVKSSNVEHYSKISVWDLEAKEWTKEKSGNQKIFPFYVGNVDNIKPEFLNYTFDGQLLILFQGGAIRILDANSLIEQSHIELDLPLLYPDGHARTTVWDMKVSPVENKAALVIGGSPTETSGLVRVYDLITKEPGRCRPGSRLGECKAMAGYWWGYHYPYGIFQ
jgi:WD40 repeat protein